MSSIKHKTPKRWGSRFGVIMAVAGSAIGLGNFLRFPGQAVLNGGGAFLIPYFVSLLLLGIPLMWIEWTVGRYGGGFGHSTAPGMFHTLWEKNRFIKYFGLVGIFGPLIIFIYYCYIESWTLGYSYYALLGRFTQIDDQNIMARFLQGYQGIEKNQFFSSLLPAYTFFLITFAINIGILYHGIKHGIERFCKIAMPVLLSFAIILMIRVLTLGTPDATKPDQNVLNGLGFLWNPDFSYLKNTDVWLAAAGQIFFTLSVGIGVILTYASYLSEGDDVALSGLSAVSTNEFTEVILAGSTIVTASFIFFGAAGAREIVEGSIFNLGFITMPLILNQLAFSQLMGFLWFFLLFLAAVTSSISICEPAIAFMEDEFDLERKPAVLLFGSVTFVLCHLPILFIKHGVVDELDFWACTVCLVVFATIETILFAWVFGIDKAWDEIHRGADVRIPRVYKFIIKYVTPVFLIVLLISWLSQKSWAVITMEAYADADKPYIWGVRIILIVLMLSLATILNISWRRKRKSKGRS
jgi:neurotransmitter:Na+ symporter, NSS family